MILVIFALLYIMVEGIFTTFYMFEVIIYDELLQERFILVY